MNPQKTKKNKKKQKNFNEETQRPESKDVLIKSPDETAECRIENIIQKIDSDSQAAYIIAVSGTYLGKMFRLTPGKDFIIGRSEEADLTIDDPLASRKHARIIYQKNEILIVDNSTNGTFLNNQKISSSPLKNGDKIQIGTTTILKFTYLGKLEKTYHEKLYELSVKDPLTGAYSKHYFLDTIKAEFAYHKRHNKPLSLIIVDVDHFKEINDTYGHLAGDNVLKDISDNIKKKIREETILVRYGGDEFLILCRDCSEEGAVTVVDRIRKQIKTNNFSYRKKEISVTLSIGIATFYNENYNTHEELFLAADKALYESKEKGRNSVSSAT